MRKTVGGFVCLTGLAGAVTLAGLPLAPAAYAQSGVQHYDLPALPLARSVNGIARIAGVSVLIDGSGAGLTAAPVSGDMSLEAALGAALGGTGATWHFTGPRSLVVTVPEAGAQGAGRDGDEGYYLGQLVLSAGGFAQHLADAPASITVIDGAELESSNYTNVTDVLRNVPGVSVDTGSGSKLGAPVITMRGMSENYVLLMVDGKPLGDSQDAWYNGWGRGAKANMLPPASMIERIEVIRGPMSSLHGSAAMGGVINVITKPVSEAWSGTVTTQLTAPTDGREGSEKQLRFNLSGPLIADRLGLSIFGAASGRETDRILNGVPENSRRSLGARLTWKIDDRQSLAFDIQGTAQNNDARPGETLDPGRTASNADSEHLSYGFTHKISWNSGAETTTFLTRETLDITNSTNVSSYAKTQFNSTTSLFLNAHTITFGGDFRIEETVHDPARVPGIGLNDMTRWHAALFVEDEWQLHEDFNLTLGARFDKNERYGASLSPRVYGVWHATDSLILKGGVSTGFKVPSLKQADTSIVEPAGAGIRVIPRSGPSAA